MMPIFYCDLSISFEISGAHNATPGTGLPLSFFPSKIYSKLKKEGILGRKEGILEGLMEGIFYSHHMVINCFLSDFPIFVQFTFN